MYKLTFDKRVWIVKQILNDASVNKVASAQKVSRISVFKTMQRYNDYSWDGLKDNKTGRREVVLSRNAEIIILDLRQRFGYGACRIEQLLKRRGFGIKNLLNYPYAFIKSQ